MDDHLTTQASDTAFSAAIIKADVDPVPAPPARLSWPLTIGRFFLALMLGYGGCVATQLAWIGLLVLIYGSLDEALNKIRPSALTFAVTIICYSTITSSFFGGFIGIVALGRLPAQRLTVLTSFALGTMIAVAAGIAIVFPLALAVERFGDLRGVDNLLVFAIAALIFGAVTGVVGGWLAARLAARRERNVKTPSPPASRHP
jgi:hypothetical protein